MVSHTKNWESSGVEIGHTFPKTKRIRVALYSGYNHLNPNIIWINPSGPKDFKPGFCVKDVLGVYSLVNTHEI